MTRWILPFAIFFSAVASLAVELAIVRLGAPYVGQSLVPWSAAIASVLLGLTVGHVLGGLMAEATTDVRRLKLGLGFIWLTAALAVSVIPGAVGFLVQTFASEPDFGNGAVLALAALALPPSLAAGFVAPLAVRIAVLTPQADLSRTVGAIYAASALGSVVGTALAGFVVLETVGAAGLIGFVCAIWTALGIFMLPWRESTAVRQLSSMVALVGLVAIASLLAAPGPCLWESRYTCIRLFDRPLEDGGLLRFMVLDEGVHSASDRDDPEKLHLGYAALTDRLARTVLSMSSKPQALVVGGGGTTLPRAWSSSTTFSLIEVMSIELDPVVASVANDRMWAGGRSRLTTLVGDGRAVVRGLPSAMAFDVILMDAYRTRSVPPHLVSREFGAMIASRLSAKGVYLSNIIDRTATPSLAASVATTLSKVFPTIDVWVAGGEQGATTNYVVAAWKDDRSAYRPDTISVEASVMNAGEAVQSRIVEWRRVDVALANTVWPDACAAVLTDDWAPVDRLMAGRRVCGLAGAP